MRRWPDGLTSKPKAEARWRRSCCADDVRGEAEPLDLALHAFEGSGRDLVRAVERVADGLARDTSGRGDVDDRGSRARRSTAAPASSACTPTLPCAVELIVHIRRRRLERSYEREHALVCRGWSSVLDRTVTVTSRITPSQPLDTLDGRSLGARARRAAAASPALAARAVHHRRRQRDRALRPLGRHPARHEPRPLRRRPAHPRARSAWRSPVSRPPSSPSAPRAPPPSSPRGPRAGQPGARPDRRGAPVPALSTPGTVAR